MIKGDFYCLYKKELKNGDLMGLLLFKLVDFFLIPTISIKKDQCGLEISLIFLSVKLQFYKQWDLPF